MTVHEMGARLMAGQQTLNLYVEVRLLCAQLLYRLFEAVFYFPFLMIQFNDLSLYDILIDIRKGLFTEGEGQNDI